MVLARAMWGVGRFVHQVSAVVLAPHRELARQRGLGLYGGGGPCMSGNYTCATIEHCKYP